MNLPELTCDVCGKEPAVGVASSCLGPCSFAYGRECLRVGAEPYCALIGALADCGREHCAEWVHPIIEASLKVAGKTLEEFDADLATAAAECEAYCKAHEGGEVE